MHPSYSDITSRLGEPLWWYSPDAAIPRYEPFHPELCGIYDKYAALVQIRCQSCHRQLSVSVSYSDLDRMQRNNNGVCSFPEIEMPTAADARWFDAWGDPPQHDCEGVFCHSGSTMTSELVRIVEFWGQPSVMIDWQRMPEYEFDYSAQLLDRDGGL